MVQARHGHYVEGRALLNNGSQSNFITNFFKRLKLTAMENRIENNGVNSVVSHAAKTANIKLTSCFGIFDNSSMYNIIKCYKKFSKQDSI